MDKELKSKNRKIINNLNKKGLDIITSAPFPDYHHRRELGELYMTISIVLANIQKDYERKT